MKQTIKYLTCILFGHSWYGHTSTIQYVDKTVEVTICRRCKCVSEFKLVRYK